MSDVTIVGPPDETAWMLEPRIVAAAFQRDWPGVRIFWDTDPESEFAFDFALEIDQRYLDGRFDRDGQALLIHDGRGEDVAGLVVWFRGLVPPSQPLGAWSGSGEHCLLMPGMTVADFLRDFH